MQLRQGEISSCTADVLQVCVVVRFSDKDCAMDDSASIQNLGRGGKGWEGRYERGGKGGTKDKA